MNTQTASVNVTVAAVTYTVTTKQGSVHSVLDFSAETIKDFVKALCYENMAHEAAKEQLEFIFTAFRNEGDKAVSVKDKMLAYYNEVRAELLKDAEINLSRVCNDAIRDWTTGELLGYFELAELDGGTCIRVYGINGWLYIEKSFTNFDELLPLWGHQDIAICSRYSIKK
jgi:hypothetical protein